MAPLDEYRSKRDFRRTPEPAGKKSRRRKGGGGAFVIQKHAATRLHFDLRLEHQGVFLSWAVPKGPAVEAGEKRLAVQVEDHPLEYGDFEGVIPEGEYGGGTVMLWDRGHWQPTGKFSEHHIDFRLEGSKLRGEWTLVRMRGSDDDGGKDWLLIKRSDDEQPAPTAGGRDRSVLSGRTMKQIASDRDRTWTSSGERDAAVLPAPAAARLTGARRGTLPEEPKAQLATLVDEAPDSGEWLHEIKFDGYRILARISKGAKGRPRVQLFSRNGKDWTDRFPEIAARLADVASGPALLDGEMVAFSRDGSSSFRRLQEALSSGRSEALVYQAFDLLHLDGTDLRGVAQLERKVALEQLLAASRFPPEGNVRYTDHLEGRGPEFLEQVCGLGLEGIISKRADGRYQEKRGRQWLKVKCVRNEELLVGGYTEPEGSREGFGALLLGAFDEAGRLVHTGKVGTGFSHRQLAELARRLEELEVDECPFEPPPAARRGVHWVRPVLVVEVEFTEWTRDGALRHPTFRGVREDRDPEEITLPDQAERAARGAPRSREEAAAAGKPGTEGGGEGKAAGKSGAADSAGRGARPLGASGGRRKASGKAGDEAEVAGVRLTNPQRVLYPDQGVTKLALANYYVDIADWILPSLVDRPLSLVRCPEGHARHCFFQKHPGETIAKGSPRVLIEESDGAEEYLYVRRIADVVALVQAGALELHVWGSRVDMLERPDILVFDLDPAPEVPWSEMLRVAKELRERLEELGLASYPRTTGGKGLHLVAPLRRTVGWEEAKSFAHGVANAHASDDRQRLTTNMSKAKRHGRIFLDYLRNGRGATAIASYSTRARDGAPVAAPVRWDELNAALRADRYDIDNLRRRLVSLRGDPWEGFEKERRAITRAMLKSVGADSAKVSG